MIHIIGSNGYIGKRLARFMQSKEPILTYSNEHNDHDIYFDILNLQDSVFSRISKGDYVVFLVAISSPDLCESEPALARRINVVGTSAFLEECFKRGAKVLFFSSDIVNGLQEGVCDENSPKKPIGNYGKMKAEIEEKFKDNALFKVFRLSYVYSGEDKFSSYLSKCVESSVVADVFDGLYRNVIHINDVFCAIENLEKTFSQWPNYAFNLSGDHCLSRLDLAVFYQKFVCSRLKYKTIPVPPLILLRSPNKIETRSLYLENLLRRKPYNFCKGE